MAAKTTNTSSPHHAGNSSLKFPKDKSPMTISPKELNIVWGGDSRYWNVQKEDKSAAAVLNQVYWLEVTGSVDEIQPDKRYEVCFKVSLTPDAFGFGGSPLYVMVKRGKEGKFAWSKTLLDVNKTGELTQYVKGKLTDSENQGQYQSTLYFGLYEVWSGKWKGGLKIHEVVIREL